MQSMSTRRALGHLHSNFFGEPEIRRMDKHGNYFERELPGERVGRHLGPRTKVSHPHNFDPILQYKKVDTLPQRAVAEYSDRLWQHDYSKYRALCLKHFRKGSDPGGDWFGGRSATDMEAFLRDFYEDQGLELLRVEEHCNGGNGFPTWVFWFLHTPGWTMKPREEAVAEVVSSAA